MWNRSVTAPCRSSRYALGLMVAVALCGGYVAWRYYATPPRLQASAAAVKTLDAMFTALTSRDASRLATCMDRIEQYFEAGELSGPARAELRRCAGLANQGAWRDASERLYWLVYEQQ